MNPCLPRGAGARLAAFLALALHCGVGAAQARGRPPQTVGETSASREWSLDTVTIAERYLGSGKFTRLPGPWCADAVSAWLRASGHRPLADRLAASALRYGPLELHPRRGDLVVISSGRQRYSHVGLLVADLGDEIEIISGNWSHRVARARILRRRVAAFVRVRA